MQEIIQSYDNDETQDHMAYVIRRIVGGDAPANQGCLRPVNIITPMGTLVNPEPQNGVAEGNVETS